MDAELNADDTQAVSEALAGLNPVGSIATREQLRNAIVTGIDSAMTGILARWMNHDTKKILQAQRAFYNAQTEQTNAALDETLKLYFQQP